MVKSEVRRAFESGMRHALSLIEEYIDEYNRFDAPENSYSAGYYAGLDAVLQQISEIRYEEEL